MRTHLISMVVGLCFTSFAQGAPALVVAKTPSLACPQTELGDANLQSRYRAIWQQYSDKVDTVSKKLKEEVEKQTRSATATGNLDLALFWKTTGKEFQQRGELRWDEPLLKKGWSERFGDASFPVEFSVAVKRASEAYASARKEIEEGYGELVAEFTKAEKLEEALKVRSEIKGLLTEKVPPSVVEPAPIAKSEPSVNKSEPRLKKPLLERMAGKWGHPNENLIRVVQANGEFLEVSRANGSRHATGKIMPKTDEVAIATLGNGWVLELRLSEDGQVIACLFRDPQGQEATDGVVMRRLP